MIKFAPGATSKSVDVFVPDSSSTVGAGLSGLLYNTSGLKCYYRKGATGTPTAVTLATQTVGGAWSSGGFVETDATNEKGKYRFDIPNTVLDTAGYATLYFYGAANMAPVIVRILIEADAPTAAQIATAVHGSDYSGVFDANSFGDVVKTISTNASTLASRLSASRAGYLDNLNVGGAVASQADITALNQSASRRIIITTVQQYEIPESGSSTYTIEVRTYDGDGAAVNADSTPTLTATGMVSGSLAANLSAATNPATGLYRWTYTNSSSATSEQIRFDASATIGGSTFTLSCYTQAADFVSAEWTATDKANLTAIYNDWADGGRLDLLLDGTKAKADLLNADVATWATRGLTTIELDGIVYRFTTNALEQAPSGGGGGGDATLANQLTILGLLQEAEINLQAIVADDGTLSLYYNRRYDGTAHAKIPFTVSKDYSSASSVTLKIYTKDDADEVRKSVTAVVASATSITVTMTATGFDPELEFDGVPLVCELRYDLIATYASGDESIQTGPCFIYKQPATS